jgi:hypothetical protein
VLIEPASADAEQERSIRFVVLGLPTGLRQLTDGCELNYGRADAGKPLFPELTQEPDRRYLIDVRPLVGQDAFEDQDEPE